MKKSSGVSKYLDSLGLLADPDPVLIAAAKKQYWQGVRARWRQSKRATLTLQLTADQQADLKAAATRHHRSLSGYTAAAALAYTGQYFLQPDPQSVNTIRMLLTQLYCMLRQTDGQPPLPQAAEALERIEALEVRILGWLEHPAAIDAALQAIIEQHPEEKARLIRLISSCP